MVNLAVIYQRANYAVTTLSAEVKAVWGAPSRAPEYVTGYKSATNLTGHNADSNGICHAVDLFFSNNSAWSEDRGWELAEWLRTVEGPKGVIPGYPDRMYYIIYRDRIAGDFSGWQWVGSGYGHWDHIHVSTCDMFWGDPAPIPAGDYDSKAPWGFASPGLASAGETITPIQEDELSAAEVNEIVHRVNVFAQANAIDVGAITINEVRVHTKHNADRILDALKTIPQIDASLIDGIKDELAAAANESIEGIKTRLNGLTVTLESRAD